MSPRTWTDEAEAELRERWAAGEAIRVIAKALGVSRNAVIGKSDRLMLNPHPQGHSPTGAPSVRQGCKRPRGVDGSAIGNLRRVIACQEATPRPAEAPPMRPEPQTYLMRLLDLGPRQCRAPDPTLNGDPAEFRFCGRPTPSGDSYCPTCAQMLRSTDRNIGRDRPDFTYNQRKRRPTCIGAGDLPISAEDLPR